MAEIAEKHSSRLKELKKMVEEAQEYFDDNVKRFEKFTNFVFRTTMTSAELAALAENGKPNIEFNILESFISRLRGEFAKQEPALTVRAADGVPVSMLDKQFSETLDVIEAHLRAIFFDGTNDLLDYNVYSDLLAGGYSAMHVYTEYVNEKSFEQNILVERVFDPTLTVWDPLARKSHKGDGRYAGMLFPMPKKAFEEEFGKEAADEIKFTRNIAGFDWSFKNETQEIVLVCELYEKKVRKETILKLSNGHSLTKREYEKFLEEWEESGMIEQPPIPINERRTQLEYIVRYRFCESRVLDYIETNYKYLPLVFVDGNSVVLKDSGSYVQFTRPYVYHAEGSQRLKNYAGQSLANELENTVTHRIMAPIEGIPEGYLEPYQNVQKPNTLLYKYFNNPQDPTITLPPPTMIARTPIPPEITNTFHGVDQTIERSLGSFDQNQGIANAPMSGVAFARSAIQGNSASVPYIVGYIKGLNRVAQIIVDLIPKYYRTPRSLPILLPNGKRSFTEINKKGSLYMNFDPNNLQVKVETGINFAIQKEVSLQMLNSLQQSNPMFAKFMGDEGLPILLDNIDIRGIDQIKEKANTWMQKQKQMEAQQMQMAQQQQQMQMQQQQKEVQIQMQKQQMEMAMMQKEIQSPSQTQVESMFIQQKAQTDAANLAIKAQDSETKYLEVISKIRSADVQNELKAAELMAEQERTAVESVLEVSKHINEVLKEENENG